MALRTYLLLTIGILLADPALAQEKKTNRLSRESSPYLLQHAHNPVDWYPWGAEAFARAQKEKKYIFLSIGYSSCHWCHVMERESFSHDEVAKILNENFICIKVDREERPDVDAIYMAALEVTGRNGGWPLSMFLTSDGRPILGGTYWPREDRMVDGEKLMGFKSVLSRVLEIIQKEPDRLEKQATQVAERTRESLVGMTRGVAILELDRKLVEHAVEALEELYDPDHGGFGSRARRFRGAKFPTPPSLLLLHQEANRAKPVEAAARMLGLTLDRMAAGGIQDHLGGGFHRYSTERTWTVPHFEKMLYDNAQLVEVYALTHARTKDPAHARTVRQALEFIAREMTSPEGAFYSALDADSEDEEGKFYVWTEKEIDAACADATEATLVKQAYGVVEKPNFEEKAYVLTRRVPLAVLATGAKLTPEETEKRLESARQRLLKVREKRPRPFLDTKVLTAWNGQMIAAYAQAGRILKEPAYTATAVRAAEFVLAKLRTPEGRLRRTWSAGQARLNAYLDDYAFLTHGLLCLHEATGDRRWLDQAKALTDTMIQHHADDKGGGFYYTAHDHEKLFARAKDQFDGAQPSGNSVAVRNLVRLGIALKEPRYRDRAEKTMKTFGATLKTSPVSLATMIEALALFLDASAKEGK